MIGLLLLHISVAVGYVCAFCCGVLFYLMLICVVYFICFVYFDFVNWMMDVSIYEEVSLVTLSTGLKCSDI